MSGSHKLIETFSVESTTGVIYLGGKVHWSRDGRTLLCPAGDVLNVFSVETGAVLGKLGAEDGVEVADTLLAVTADPDCKLVVSAHRSGLFKLWNVSDFSLVKTWKSVHRGPVAQLALNGNTLASGGVDGIIRLWDLEKNACTHALRGCQGVISVLEFFGGRIFACGDDLKIRAWDLKSGELSFELTGHFSKVTGLAFSGEDLVSCGRDKVLICWNLKTGTSEKTIPVYETLEGVFVVPKNADLPNLDQKNGLLVGTAGDKGVVRIFDCKSGKEVFQQSDSKITAATDGGLSVVQLLVNEDGKQCAVVSVDHNIIVYNLADFACDKQFAGFFDEVLDVTFVGPKDCFLAVATNSADLKFFNLENRNCQILRGHTDFILSLHSSPHDSCLLASGGKDGQICLWKLHTAVERLELIVTANRHTAAVNSIHFFNSSPEFVSVSLDTTIKFWKNDGKAITAVQTEVAHPKDINCVTVSPNDKIAATASLDKTIKLWKLPSLTLLGTLTGHRRGVWCVRFSPVDQIVLSCSADCTMKIWNIIDLSCLQTFEGHESSVLKAEFLLNGMQIISGGGDGLLKLWTVKSSECVETLSGHEGKIWALDVSHDEKRLITGGTDAQLIVWRDTTEEKKREALEKQEEILKKEQELSNLLQADRLLDALKLALWLNRPYKTLAIIKDVVARGKTPELTDAIILLDDSNKEILLDFAAAWNCNAKHCVAAQLVISILLPDIATGSLKLKNLTGFVRDVLPYTDRHFRRLSQSLQSLQLLNYTIRKINPAIGNEKRTL